MVVEWFFVRREGGWFNIQRGTSEKFVVPVEFEEESCEGGRLTMVHYLLPLNQNIIRQKLTMLFARNGFRSSLNFICHHQSFKLVEP